MTANTYRLTRKGLLLLAVLGLLALTGLFTSPQPAEAWCDPVWCLWEPPMHWSYQHCACVCDCPIDPEGDVTNWQNCGPCW
jgi:hypothetical protein